MSELVPFFDEDEQLDDNLLRSIETLLDDNEQSMDGMCIGGKKGAASMGNGMLNAPPNTPVSPMPQYETLDGSSFAFGSQVYQKWSTNESNNEVPNAAGPKRNYNRNQSRPANFGKTAKKNIVMQTAQINANVQIAQYQAMLAEKANQLLHQYLRLNYESLNAQAQILGIPLDQYIRNLLVALNTQSLLMPQLNSPFLYASINPTPVVPQTTPMTMTMPNIAQQRAFAKQYFNNKKF